MSVLREIRNREVKTVKSLKRHALKDGKNLMSVIGLAGVAMLDITLGRLATVGCVEAHRFDEVDHYVCVLYAESPCSP